MRQLLVLSFIWGWSFLFIRVIGEGAPPAFVAWGRIAIGAVVVLVYVRARRVRLPRDVTIWLKLGGAALCASVIPFMLFAKAEQEISSALAGVLNASTPIFTAVLAVPLLGERLRPLQAVGLGIAVAGVAVLSGIGGSDVSGSSVVSALMVVGASALYGIAFCIARRMRTIPPLVMTAGQLAAGSVLAAPLALWQTTSSGLHLTPTRLLCLVLLGAIGTGAAYVLNFGIVAAHGATFASLVTFIVPVVAVTVGIVVGGEDFSWRLAAGGPIVLAGVALVQRKPRATTIPDPKGLVHADRSSR